MSSTNQPEELSASTTTTLKGQCFCKAVQFTVTVPNSKLPLSAHMCHCYICRHTHGTMCIFHAPLPSGVEPVFDPPPTATPAATLSHPAAGPTPVTSLASFSPETTAYTHSQALSHRLFCSTCGCHVGDQDTAEAPDPTSGKREWRVATSVFAPEDQKHFKLSFHVFTKAGPGVAMHTWLTEIDGRKLGSWHPGPEDEAVMWTSPTVADELLHPKTDITEDGVERLRAACYCGGVSFTIPRPTVPEIVDDKDLAKCISPLDNNKYIGTLDACDDCRLVSGAHVIGWTFVPRKVLRPAPPPDLAGFGTLKTYKSSENVIRGFCGCCGATVFFYYKDGKENPGEVLDIAVGILCAPEGVAAENWLTWRTGKISWFESGKKFDPTFAEALRQGLDQWGTKTYGESPNFEIG